MTCYRYENVALIFPVITAITTTKQYVAKCVCRASHPQTKKRTDNKTEMNTAFSAIGAQTHKNCRGRHFGLASTSTHEPPEALHKAVGLYRLHAWPL